VIRQVFRKVATWRRQVQGLRAFGALKVVAKRAWSLSGFGQLRQNAAKFRVEWMET
jgi:hypothetical protein